MDINDREYAEAELPDSPLPISPVFSLPEYEEPESQTVSTHPHSATDPTDEPPKQEASYCSSGVSKVDLQRIAHNLPYDKWKPLGRVLGLSERDLDIWYHDPVEQCYQMLLLWQHSQAQEATWEKLTEALHSDAVGCPKPCLHLARQSRTSATKPGVCMCVVHAHAHA